MGSCTSRSNRYNSASDLTAPPGARGGTSSGRHGDDHPRHRETQLRAVFTEPVFDVTSLSPATPSQFAACCDDGRIAVYDWLRPGDASVSCVWQAHPKCVNRLAYGGVAGLLGSCSRDATARLWRVGTPEPVTSFAGHGLTISGIDFSPDNRFVCTGSRDTSVRVWDVEASRESARNAVQLNVVTDVKWLSGHLSTVIAQASEDLNVKLWDTRSAGSLKLTNKLDGYIYFPLCLDVSPDGLYMLTSSKGFNGNGAEARLWDLRTLTEVCQYAGHEFDAVACAFLPPSPEGVGRVLTASKDGTIRVWDQRSGACLIRHQEGHAGSFTALAVLPPAPREPHRLRIAATTVASAVLVYEVDEAASRLVCLAAAPPASTLSL